MPFRAESSSFRAYSARKPFPFHVCTMDADGSGNKRLTEKSEEKDKTAYRLVQIGMGRRQTALPPEKSKSLCVLCVNAWVISSFCICMPPCTLSSVSFLCQKHGRESYRLPVYKAEFRCCGSPARFSGSLSAGMPLPCPSAVHRHRQTVAVFPTTFRAGPAACRNSSGTPLPTHGPFL